MRVTFLLLPLGLAACSEAPLPPPVTAARLLEVPGIQSVVNAVALRADGGVVVVGDVDGGLVAREVATGAELWTIRVHSRGAARRIDGVFVSPDGSLVVTTGHDARTVEVWDTATGRSTAVLDIGNSRGVAFHPVERGLAVAAATAIQVVDLDRGEVVRTLPNAHAGDAVYAIAFAGDGQTLASISEQGSLKVWSWPGLVLRSSVTVPSGLESLAPVSLTLTRSGTRAATNGILGRVYVVDTAKGREERAFANVAEAPGHGMHAELRYSLAFTEDGDWLFAPDTHDRGLRLLHVPSGKAYPVLRGEGPFYKAVAFAVPAGMVALLRPGDDQGRGPYGLEVWQLTYPAAPR
jgi:WD domain, G-beta repeat